MTPVEFAAFIRFHTHTDATTFTDPEILLLSNTYKDKMAVRILGANENYFGVPMATDLVADQREYPLDVAVAGQFKFIDIKLDGLSWKRIYETDFNLETFAIQEGTIREAMSGRAPQFAIFRNSLWILSDSAIIAVTAGLKIWAYIWPANFTNLASTTEMSVAPSSTTHGWPRQFQELLARKVIIAYKESRDKPISLSQTEQSWGSDFLDMLDGIMHPNQDRSVTATVPANDGSNY
jgi:hypothetical protein